MATELAKQYEPKSVQPKWLSAWAERGYFDANPHPGKPQHTIMIPLPNVTGALHMGHALNGTLQDLLTRWRRMQGYEALWMPGTDHAGIATQAVVERRMFEEEKLTRHDIGRDALVARIWKWKDEYEARILSQLRGLGASCDWRRTRFTLDPICSKAVRRTFFNLFCDGLIYRGKRLVNWDTFLQTAVADDEVFHETVKGHFWTFTYPVIARWGDAETRGRGDAGTSADEWVETGESIAFSTTRPETMLGDTAVAVHPQDERYRHLVGKRVRIPLNGRDIPIIADPILVDRTLGTGAVKVTPAHDHNDYACGQRNKLPMINLLNPNGTLNENAGRWQGMDRYDVRKQVVLEMERLGRLVQVEERDIELAHSDRSKTPIEPYLSDQWFVKMDTLAEVAMNAVRDGRVKFYPPRYTKTYLDWLGEKRDWCISRQLWWGHRIPVWVKVVDCTQQVVEKFGKHGEPYVSHLISDEGKAASPKPEWSEFVSSTIVDGPGRHDFLELVCVDAGHEDIEKQLEADGFTQDPDVLDTWFSSALWPHATLGWPDIDHDPPLETSPLSPLGRGAGGEGSAAETARTAPHPSPLPKGEREQPHTNTVLPYFYPGSVLVTSRDIITLWVARMVIMGLYNMRDVPFRHVHVHPKILDGFGQTMSKSKGNGVDPVDLIDKYGVDAVRFTITSLAGENQDVRLPVGYECPHCGEVIPQTLEHQRAIPAGGAKPRAKCPKCKKESQYSSPWFQPDAGEPVARVVSERFEYGRNFCNKLWNAARFAMMNLVPSEQASGGRESPESSGLAITNPSEGLRPPLAKVLCGYTPGEVSDADLMLEDRWILSRLSTTATQITQLLDGYHFDTATRALRDFTWNEFCDWYLEMIKPRLRDESRRPAAQRVLVGVLDVLLRLLSPFTPFIAEELWQRLGEIAPQRGLPKPQPTADAAMIAPWPVLPAAWRDEKLEARFERLQETIIAVRNVRAVYGIASGVELALHVKCTDDVASQLHGVAGQFENLAKTVLKAAGVNVERPKGAATFSLNEADGYIPLEGIINREAELARQKKEADKLRGFISGHEKKLANESFVSKAPPDVVAQARETLAGLKKQLESVEAVIQQLGDA